MNLTDAEKAVLLLATRLGDAKRPSFAPVGFAELQRRFKDAGLSLTDVFDRPEDASECSGDSGRLADLLATGTAALVEAEQLSQRGIWTLTLASDDYPAGFRQLGDNQPPAIFGIGNASLLGLPSIAFVGSRNVDPDGAEATTALAQAAVEAGYGIVSGAARGVDQLSMQAGLGAGGSVVGALADSLTRRAKSADVLEHVDGDRLCLITQQHPHAGFTAGAAMARNKLIYALAELTIVIASDENSGGTWAGATESLNHRYGRVAVWRGDGEGPGNAELESRGAAPMSSFADVVELLADKPADQPEQLTLIE